MAWATAGANGSKTLFVSVARAGHRFGRSIRIVSASQISPPAGLEVQPGGRIVLLWSRSLHVSSLGPSENGIYSGLLSPSGSRLRTGSIMVAHGPPSVTVTATGAVLVASPTVPSLPAAGQPAINQQAQVSMLAPGASSFAGAQTIYALPGQGSAEAAGIGAFAGPGGSAVAFGGQGIQPNALEIAQLAPSGLFGSPLTATAIDISTGTVGYTAPVAALPADGAQAVAWTLQQLNNPTDQAVTAGQVLVTVRPAGAAAFGAPTTLSSGPGIPSGPLAGSAAGTTVMLWSQTTRCRQRVYFALRRANGVFATASRLSPTFTIPRTRCGYSNQTQLALNGAGSHLIAGWLQGDVLHAATLSE